MKKFLIYFYICLLLSKGSFSFSSFVLEPEYYNFIFWLLIGMGLFGSAIGCLVTIHRIWIDEATEAGVIK